MTESRRFRRSYTKIPIPIKEKYLTAVTLFCTNPFDERLNNHGLHGNLFGYRSFNVTGNWRVIFKELSDSTYELIELIDIGTHSQLY